MSDAERRKWDGLYGRGEYRPRSRPSPFLLEWLPHAPPGRALDVACGTGRHALALARAGFRVDAVDISTVAVDRARADAEAEGLDIAWHVADLDTLVPAPDTYTLISVFRYRNRELWPRLARALAPGGWILAEHHLRTATEVAGPPGDEFRLAPQELLEAFGHLRVMHYSERLEPADLGGTTYAIARLAACRGGPGW